MTWIKICGTTNLEDAQMCVEAGADALGFIFAESPRRIEPLVAAEIIKKLPFRMEKIGVFVNMPAEQIWATVVRAGLTTVQLHGGESQEFIETFVVRRDLGAPKIKVFQALSISGMMQTMLDGGHEPLPLEVTSGIDAVLVDSGDERTRGGTGKPFEWKIAELPISLLRSEGTKIIVAGGLRADNVAKAMCTFLPWGVDVVSGVEASPGKKDPKKVKAFVEAVRTADRSD